MADFATGYARGFHFAHREGGEVVVQHETLGFIPIQGIHALFVGGTAQSGHGNGLGFAARENHGAMGAGQNAGFNFHGAHGPGVAAIDAGTFLENTLTHQFLFQMFKDNAHFFLSFSVFRPFGISGEHFLDLLLDGRSGFLAGQLVGNAQGFRHARIKSQLFHMGINGGVVFLGCEGSFGLACKAHQLFLSVDERLDGLVAPVQSFNKHGFGHKFGLTFHHDHGVAGSGEHDVELAALQLPARGVDHKFAVHAADAAAGNGAVKGNGRKAHSGGSGADAQHVGLILAVSGNDAGQHLHFVSVALGKERTNRAVDQAGHQRFMVAGAADFAPEKVARDTSGGIHLLTVFHSKGEEILRRFQRLFADRDQSHGAFALNPHRAVRLTRHAACFQNNLLAADGGGHSRSIQKTHINTPGRRLREKRRSNAAACPPFSGLTTLSAASAFPQERLRLFSRILLPCIAPETWCSGHVEIRGTKKPDAPSPPW